MKLTNAYIIDGDVIEKRIAELKRERCNFIKTEMPFIKITGALEELENLKQNLKSLFIEDYNY